MATQKNQKKTNSVWNHYTLIPNTQESKAKCIHCGKIRSRGKQGEDGQLETTKRSLGTTNMCNHLSQSHIVEAPEFCEQTAAPSGDVPAPPSKLMDKKLKTMKQMSLLKSLGASKPWKRDSDRYLLGIDHLLNLIAIDNQPLSIVEDPGFV